MTEDLMDSIEQLEAVLQAIVNDCQKYVTGDDPDVMNQEWCEVTLAVCETVGILPQDKED